MVHLLEIKRRGLDSPFSLSLSLSLCTTLSSIAKRRRPGAELTTGKRYTRTPPSSSQPIRRSPRSSRVILSVYSVLFFTRMLEQEARPCFRNHGIGSRRSRRMRQRIRSTEHPTFFFLLFFFFLFEQPRIILPLARVYKFYKLGWEEIRILRNL